MAKNKFIYWAPRILSILFILFLAMFSLDVFESCNGFLECLLGLFMHNLPALILLIVIIISWKHELVGAVVFGLAGILYIAQLAITTIINWNSSQSIPWYVFSWSIIIAGPAILVSILFYIGWKKKH